MGTAKRRLFLLMGHTMLGLGIIGIVVPLLPTTVFFLSSAWFYARSSPRWEHWLLNNRYFGAYIRDYVEKRGISLNTKIITLGLLWLTLGFSQSFLPMGSWVRALLGAIGIAVSVHVACLKLKTTTKPQQKSFR